MPTIRGVLRGVPCPGHPANQTHQIKEARHPIEEAPEASDLQMPEGRSVNVNPPQPAKEALRPSEQDCRLIVDSIPGHVVVADLSHCSQVIGFGRSATHIENDSRSRC